MGLDREIVAAEAPFNGHGRWFAPA
jgi:hypothetical protein